MIDDVFESYGFSLLESASQLQAHEKSVVSLSGYEDAASQHKKHHRKHTGTQHACILTCEKGLPHGNATMKQNQKYQEKHNQLSGGFNPLDIIKGNKR